jgi:hypothetical protein
VGHNENCFTAPTSIAFAHQVHFDRSSCNRCTADQTQTHWHCSGRSGHHVERGLVNWNRNNVSYERYLNAETSNSRFGKVRELCGHVENTVPHKNTGPNKQKWCCRRAKSFYSFLPSFNLWERRVYYRMKATQFRDILYFMVRHTKFTKKLGRRTRMCSTVSFDSSPQMAPKQWFHNKPPSPQSSK